MPKSAMKSKAMKAAKAMTKAQLADQLATKSELKKKDTVWARSCSGPSCTSDVEYVMPMSGTTDYKHSDSDLMSKLQEFQRQV